MSLQMKSPRWVVSWTDDPKAADLLGADDRPFYQPEDIEQAIAEAVAAERERCVKVCEESAPKGDYSILGNVGDALRRAAEAIRSAAK